MDKKRKRLGSDGLAGYLFIAPSFILMLTFVVLPVIAAFVLSFTRWNLTISAIPKFIGFENYLDAFKDDVFYKSLLHTFIYAIIAVPISVLLALVMAVFLNQPIKGVKVYRLIYFIPSITTITAITTVWGFILNPENGLMNIFLKNIGIKNPPGWLASETWALPALIIIGFWMWLGNDMIIYIAGLKSIPKELYEASKIDGANTWQNFRHITIPMVSPTTFYLIVTGTISAFQIFDLVYVFTQGGPAGRTEVINLYIYENGFRFLKMGYASALSYLLFIIIMGLTVIQWIGQKRWVNYND